MVWEEKDIFRNEKVYQKIIMRNLENVMIFSG